MNNRSEVYIGLNKKDFQFFKRTYSQKIQEVESLFKFKEKSTTDTVFEITEKDIHIQDDKYVVLYIPYMEWDGNYMDTFSLLLTMLTLKDCGIAAKLLVIKDFKEIADEMTTYDDENNIEPLGFDLQALMKVDIDGIQNHTKDFIYKFNCEAILEDDQPCGCSFKSSILQTVCPSCGKEDSMFCRVIK